VNWLPGWTSADDAGWWSSFHFWFGVASLVLLGCGEVLSHFYALRRDELVAISERAIDEQRDLAQRDADRRHEADTTALQRKAEAAELALIELQKQRKFEKIPLYRQKKIPERSDVELPEKRSAKLATGGE
jgi:hypothetical protein